MQNEFDPGDVMKTGAVRELADFLYGLGEIWQRVSEIYKNYLLNSPVFCETFYLSSRLENMLL